MLTARQNIERLLAFLELSEHVNISEEREDRVLGVPSLELRNIIQRRQWRRDIGDPSRLHPGATESYREPDAVLPAMQICFRGDGLVEIDIDLASPVGGDLVSFFVHAAEVFWHWIARTKSNQERISEWLDRRIGKNATPSTPRAV